MIDAGLYISYALLGLAAIATIVLPLLNSLKNPKGLVKSAMAVGGLVVVFFITYAMSGEEVSAKAASLGVGASGSKMIGAGLMMFYVVFIIAIIGIIYSEIAKALK